MHFKGFFSSIRQIQCPPLNRITLGQHKSDNNNRIIQLTDGFYALFMYKQDQ